MLLHLSLVALLAKFNCVHIQLNSTQPALSPRMLQRTLILALALLGCASAYTSSWAGSAVQHSSTLSSRTSSRGEGITMRKRPVSPMKGKSKVVLTKSVASLGAANDVVTVRDGFFMNYLLPRGMAARADAATLADVAAAVEANAKVAAEALEEAKVVVGKLEGLSGVSIAKKTGEGGSIFGSVSASDVIAALETASGLKLGSPKVVFDEISAVGSFTASVAVHPTLSAEVKFDVVAA